jgi:hypothetical protein
LSTSVCEHQEGQGWSIVIHDAVRQERGLLPVGSRLTPYTTGAGGSHERRRAICYMNEEPLRSSTVVRRRFLWSAHPLALLVPSHSFRH